MPTRISAPRPRASRKGCRVRRRVCPEQVPYLQPARRGTDHVRHPATLRRRDVRVAGAFDYPAAYPVTNTSWAQNAITFNNAPVVGSPAISTLVVNGTTPQTYTVDLTSYLQQRQAAGKTLVSVALEGVQFTSGGTQFSSTLAATGHPRRIVDQSGPSRHDHPGLARAPAIARGQPAQYRL